MLRPFLADGRPRVASRAVVALGALCGGDAAPQLLAALSSPHPRVSRCAQIALLPHVHGYTRELHRLTETPHPVHVYRNVLRLAANLAAWDSLAVMLSLAKIADESLTERVQRHLDKWPHLHSRQITRAPAVVADDIQGLLADSRVRIGEELRREIEARLTADA